ncbi:hypothetical protein HDK77DRAFT_68988 [Phyllosticta capitalensis]|uniref:Secreted protein n=1 Tax=Phyllosticta capitalensis TaxID=121624 RepID=A0ABR1YQF9_9PEZI
MRRARSCWLMVLFWDRSGLDDVRTVDGWTEVHILSPGYFRDFRRGRHSALCEEFLFSQRNQLHVESSRFHIM